MNKPILLLLGLVFLSGSLTALDVRLGPVASLSGLRAAELIFEGPINWFSEELRPEAGLEAGLLGNQLQVLVPLGLMWESRLERGWSWGASVHALGGTTLGQSEAAFLWGGETELRGEWSWTPGIGLALGAGARYAGSAWDFPLHAALEISIGEADTLEPVEEKDH